MGLLNNLPVILAALTAFLTGLYGYLKGLPNSQIYGNMCLFLIVFYLIGVFVRRTAKKIIEDFEEKARLAALEEEKLRSEKLAALAAESAVNMEGAAAAPPGSQDGESGDAEIADASSADAPEYAEEAYEDADLAGLGYDPDAEGDGVAFEEIPLAGMNGGGIAPEPEARRPDAANYQ